MPSTKPILTKHTATFLLESISSFKQAQQLHAQLLTQGLCDDPQVFGKLISAFALSQKTPQLLCYSRKLLSNSNNTTTFALNSMIRAYSRSSTPEESFNFYNRILRSSAISPDNYTFTFMVRACAQASFPNNGGAVHCAAFKHGYAGDAHVQSGLIHMYAELGITEGFISVYTDIVNPDHVSQTAMLSACLECGEINYARRLFDEMPHRDAVAWNAMIAGYSHMGRSKEALELFSSMQAEGAKVTEATMVSVFTACAHLGALDQGKWAHVYVQKNNLKITVTLGTALIDMYAKCGNVKKATEVFWAMDEKNVYTWSSMLSGLAMNGAGKKCVELFELMKQDGVLPNAVTFIAVLRGCSVASLVDQGCNHFDSIRNQYGVEPTMEHYGCMVDLYARAGQLNNALDFINSMPVEPHAAAWGALLNACRIYKNKELGELAMRKLVELESRNHGAYVLLSNIYADTKNWNRVNYVRELMKFRGVRKEPGCSVIEIADEVHEFFVGDKSHPRYADIEKMLSEMSKKLRLAGYLAKTNEVLFDIEEEEKEDALCWHSEKLAIAFGLIALGEGSTIRIVKNLRVCWDCHETTKYISKVYNRELVVRDRNRFHHFRDGSCSCTDYW